VGCHKRHIRLLEIEELKNVEKLLEFVAGKKLRDFGLV
jgi:hypothetical protein